MKKIIFILTCCFCLHLTGFGQIKETVLIDYFTKERQVPLLYSERLRAEVVEGFKLRNRENVLDAEYIPEMNPQRMGGYHPGVNMEAQRNEAIANSGARYIITGHVADYRFTQTRVGNKMQYTAIFRVALNGYDFATAEQLEPEQFELTGRGDTMDQADARAIQTIASKINFYVERRMKFETEVLQLCGPDKKGRVLELYIGSGSGIGVKSGDQFDLYAEESIQGRMVRRQLGKITVQGVEGPEISRCSMKKKQAPIIIDALTRGVRLIAVSAGEALFY